MMYSGAVFGGKQADSNMVYPAGSSPSPLTRRRRLFLTCAFASMAGLNLYMLWQARTLVADGYPDFMHFYVAGRMTRTGQGSQLFDANTQLAAQRALSESVRTRGEPFIYMHPPFEALLFVPFSYLSYVDAYLLWNLLSVLALWAVPLLLRPQLNAFRGIPAWFWMIFVLAFFPVFASLLQGQDDAFFVLLMTLAYLALRRKDGLRAGSWLGLGLFRPQFVFPLMFVLLVGGEWNAVAGFAATGLCLAVLTIVVFGWPQLWGYPRHLWSSEQSLDPHGHMPNLHGLLAGMLTSRVAVTTILTLVILVSAVLMIFVAEQWKRYRHSSPDLAFSLAVVATTLVSYHAFAQDLSLLLLPILVQVNWMLSRKPRPGTVWVMLVPMLILFVTPLCYLMVQGRCFNLFALALLAWFVAGAMNIRDETGSTPVTSADSPRPLAAL